MARKNRKRKTTKPGTDEALLKALRHPLRKALLKRYIQSGEELSPSDFAQGRSQRYLSNFAYHVRTLAELGALELVSEQPVRGSVKHFYKATKKVTETPWLLALLGLPSPI